MVFVQFLKSLDELLFELVSWIVFFPVTLARVLRRPLAMMVHAEAELAKPTEDQFDDPLSPPVFLVLAIFLSHAAEVAVVGPDAVVASKRGARRAGRRQHLPAAATGEVRHLPAHDGAQHGATRGPARWPRTLQAPFYAQCLLAAPLVLAFGASFILLSRATALAEAGGIAIFLLSLAGYGAVQAAWFARRLERRFARGFFYASVAMVEALAAVAVIGFLFKA